MALVFAMSLFIGSLAFEVQGAGCLLDVKRGVLVGSLCSAIRGVCTDSARKTEQRNDGGSRVKICAYLFLTMSMVSFSASAVGNNAPDEDEHLLASCRALTANPEHESAKSCIYYIQGVIAVALSTNSVIATELSEEKSKRSSFLKRAYRTRLGICSKKRSTTLIVHYCVPDDESEARIAKRLSKQLSAPIDTTKGLRDRIHNALKAEYPCG